MASVGVQTPACAVFPSHLTQFACPAAVQGTRPASAPASLPPASATPASASPSVPESCAPPSGVPAPSALASESPDESWIVPGVTSAGASCSPTIASVSPASETGEIALASSPFVVASGSVPASGAAVVPSLVAPSPPDASIVPSCSLVVASTPPPSAVYSGEPGTAVLSPTSVQPTAIHETKRVKTMRRFGRGKTGIIDFSAHQFPAESDSAVQELQREVRALE